MKKLFCLHVLLLNTWALYAQQQTTALDTLIQTENAFAKMANDASMRQAFLYYLDSSGLVFEHATPANGIAVYQKAPEDSSTLLAWYPAVAAVSGDGTLGFTSGPFQYSITHDAAPIVYGFYFTIWKKNAAGVFKLKADGGTSYSAKAPVPMPGKLTDAHTLFSTATPAPVHNSFKKAVADFTVMVNKDMMKAYHMYLCDTPYLVRTGRMPAYDKTTALALAEALPYSNTSVTDLEAAGSNDFAYSYGQLLARPKASAEPVKTFFLRVWIYENNSWKIKAEVINIPGSH